MLRSEIPSGMCAKLRTVAASNNRDHARNLSLRTLVVTFNRSQVNIGRASTSQSLLLLLSRATHMMVLILHAHPVRGEAHIQRNTTGEAATTSPPFHNEPHRSHVLCVKAELRTTFTSMSQHHFLAIGNTERHERKASHCGSKQQ